MECKTIIFDFDGTLADSRQIIFEIAQKLYKKMGGQKTLTPETYDKLRGKTAFEIIRYLKVPFYKIPFLIREGRALFRADIPNLKLYPGTAKMLRSLKKSGYRLGILSSNPIENLEAVLVKNKIRPMFDFVFSELDLFGKDQAIRTILRKINLPKNKVIYVGDEVRDIEACRAVGIKVIAVSWGLNTTQILKEYRPDYLIDRQEKLIAIIDNHGK